MLLFLTLAHAKNVSWLREGADRVDIAGQVDLELYRGPATTHLPTIAARIPVADQTPLRSTLVVVDIAGSWSTLTVEAANALGVEPTWERLSGEWRRTVVLPRVELGDLVLHDLHVEVIPEGPAPFVLGTTTLDEVAVALLPSEGKVRFVPAAQGADLVASLGEPIPVTPQPTSTFTTNGQTFRGNGLTLRIPGALRWGEAVGEGSFHVRTDRPESRVVRSTRLPKPVQRAGEPFHDVEARLGEVWLDHTWTREVADLGDPDPTFVAELGYDVLYGLDLAVAVADGTVSFRKAPEVRFTPDRDVSIAFAKERFAQEEERRPTEAPKEGRVQIGFDGPKSTRLDLGDPGDPVIRDRNLDLAETLWRGGELDASLPYYLAASQHAGDHCLTHMRLAQRRLAWSGTRQAQGFVVDLIRQPLERSGTIWDSWLSLDQPTRDAIWEGQNVPDTPLQVFQPAECQLSWGLLAAASDAQGNQERADDIEGRYQGRDAAVDYVRGLRLLHKGQLGTAQPLLASTKSRAGVPPVDVQAAMAIAIASTDADQAKAYVRHLPHYRSDHELTTAFCGLEAARVSTDAYGIAKALRRADERWLPGQIVAAIAMKEPVPEWDPRLAQRFAGAPRIPALQAVHAAASGRLEDAATLLAEHPAPGDADWWTAKAVVAWLSGDEAGRTNAIEELRLRYPMLPIGQLGTEPIAPPPPPEPEPAPKRRGR